jgi:hypothetical protein
MTDDDLGAPIAYLVLERGTPVLTSDGVEIGRVKKVLDVPVKRVFDGVVITTKTGDRFVDAPEIARIYERAVILTIDAAAAEQLEAMPPVGRRMLNRLRGR